MKILCKEKIKVLAESNGWSLAHTEGYIDGETFRRRGTTPSTYAQIGIDEYSLGFRAGYYERQNIERPNVASTARLPGLPVAHVSLRRSRDSFDPVAATTVLAHSG